MCAPRRRLWSRWSGLLGILIGEQLLPVAKQLLCGLEHRGGVASKADCTVACLRHVAGLDDGQAKAMDSESGEVVMSAPDLIFHDGLFTTLDRSNPAASAVAIKDGVFTAVGHDGDVMKLAGPSTKVIDLKGRRVLPGLIDNHIHIIRGGLNYNMELRWDGVWSLADAMAMLKKQVAITPPPQWVRVVGGFTRAPVRGKAPADH